MSLLMIFWALTSSQQLTWYEFYERGEKRFAREEYRLCLADMDAALAQKPDPARNVFTRAVQKIDYKPFYYKAMAHYHLNDLEKAYQFAQRAFRADVVRDMPLLQSDLGAILKDYSDWMEGENARFENEKRSLNSRIQVTRLTAEGNLEEARKSLEALNPDERAALEDLRLLIENQLVSQRSEQKLRTSLVNSINTAVENGEWEAARQLIEVGEDRLSLQAKQQWLDFIARGQAFDEANKASKPAPETPLDTEEAPVEPDDGATEKMIEDFEQQIREITQQKDLAAQDMERIQAENKLLTKRLAEVPVDEPPAPPRLLIAAQREAGRRVRVEAQIIASLPVQQWSLKLNGSGLQVPEKDLTREETGFSLLTEVLVPDYGSHEFVFEAADAFGRTDSQLRQIVLPRPFWLRAWFKQLLVVLPVALMVGFLLWIWLRRRKAHLRNFNPYIAGSPVRTREMFYGRDQLLARVQGLVHKNCFMIHGERRIGKTSLLLQLKTNLQKDESSQYAFYPVFIDLQGIREEELFHHFMAEIMAQAAEWPIKTDDLDYRDHHENYQSRQFSRDVKRIIYRLREQNEKHVVVVLLVDEVDVLNEFGDKTNQKLRGIFMKEYAEFLSCVMAGIHLKKEWESSGSPWYNFFEEIPINAIDEKEAKKLILKPVRGIFKYQPEAVAHILRSSGCHPYLIQKICVSLIDESLRQKRFLVTKADVERYLINLRNETREKGQP